MKRRKFISYSLVSATGIIIVPNIMPGTRLLRNSEKDDTAGTVRIGLAYEFLANRIEQGSELDSWAKKNNLGMPFSIEAVRNSQDDSFIARLSYQDDLTILIGSCYPAGIGCEGIKHRIKSDEEVCNTYSLSLLTIIALKLERRLSWDAEKQHFKNDPEADLLYLDNLNGRFGT